MLVKVGYSGSKLRDLIHPHILSESKFLDVEFVEITDPEALYFSDQIDNPKVLTLIGSSSKIPIELSSSTYFRSILLLHIERLKLEKYREHRHTLGNLIVIFLSKILKAEEKISPEELEALNKLHQRFSHLYEEMEEIKIQKI